MKMKKMLAALIIGACMTMFSAGAAFAAETGGGTDPNTAVGHETKVDEALLQKQQEIDKYVFEDHAAEIEKQGFTVTHTAPLADHVEIGITPFDQAKADYLYGIFGKDNVKVVEGEMAVPLAGVAAADGTEEKAATTQAAAPVTEPMTANDSSSLPAVLYVIGGLAVAGAAVFGIRKLRTVKN